MTSPAKDSPRTAAGRALLTDHGYWPKGPKLATILAIEAEARSAAFTDFAKRELDAMSRIPTMSRPGEGPPRQGYGVPKSLPKPRTNAGQAASAPNPEAVRLLRALVEASNALVHHGPWTRTLERFDNALAESGAYLARLEEGE